MSRVPARLRLALAVLVGLLLAGAVGLLAAAGDDEGRAAATDDDAFAGALRPQGIPPQDFALRDQDGRRTSLRALRGQVVVLTFLYTTCEDSCPITAQQIRGALDDLDEPPPALAVSVDPAQDTPARARRFLLDQRLTGRMDFALGPRSRLAPVWRAYGIRPQAPELEHSGYVVLLDRRGRQRIGFPADKVTPEGVAHDVRMLQAEA